MKSNELRIGNKLFIGGGLKKDCVVLSISDKLIGYETETRKGECNIEWLSEIPLNQDRLSKFGFEMYEFDNKANQFRFKERLIVYRDGFLYDYGTSVKLEYVHQLQNLNFALTGTELTYEN